MADSNVGLAVGCGMDSGDGVFTELAADEMVVLYPTFAHLEPDGETWRVAVAGAVLQPDQVRLGSRILIRMLRRAMKVAAEALLTDIFRQRIRDFAASTQRGKRVAVGVGEATFFLRKPTKHNGHFAGSFRLTREEIEPLEAAGHVRDGWLHFRVVPPNGDEREFRGRALLVGRTGLSIISDIDDTLKHSEVTCRQTLLANTFLRDFQNVPGMSNLYQEWARQRAAFHYVSSSPWQLFRPLAEFFAADEFPAGTFHLRPFRLRNHLLLRLFMIRRIGKAEVIKSILRTFPERQFVLIGDSGERDPEIYGSVARMFPGQVVAIYIRDLPVRPLDEARASKAFRQLPPSLWRTFREPAELLGQFAAVPASAAISTPCLVPPDA